MNDVNYSIYSCTIVLPRFKPGMGTASHLVCLFCVTAGQNGENLGSDEEQIVLFVYLLYDVANNKVPM